MKLKLLLLLAMCVTSFSLFASSFGKDDIYLENEIEWQNVHFFWGNNPYVASLPGKPLFLVGGEALNCCSVYDQVTYTIYSNNYSMYSKPHKSVNAHINHLRDYYHHQGEILATPSNQKHVVYIIDMFEKNKVTRWVQAKHRYYRLEVEGPDLSLAPLFFDKFEIVSDTID